MFEVGKVYNRRNEIHGVYQGQQYGGIATPSKHPFVFIFTSDAGEEFGYSDGFAPDGTFRYTGEGQEGDMKMAKGNLAIYQHRNNDKEILLFESVSKGYVRFVGSCNYISHHTEPRPDKNKTLRSAIVFHLDIVPASKTNRIQETVGRLLSAPKKTNSLVQLRNIATAKTPENVTEQEQLRYIKYRSEAIKMYAKKRANGACEGCEEKAPFMTSKGPYLEVHHLTRLADGGADCPENVIALCATCHRRAHYSVEHIEFNSLLCKKAATIEDGIANYSI